MTEICTLGKGFHHIALVCKNMKDTIKFYEGATGMELRAIYPMHGIKGAKHCFLEATNEMRIKLSVASLRCVHTRVRAFCCGAAAPGRGELLTV